MLNHLGQNFLAVVRVEEEDSSNSMLTAPSISESCCVSAFSDMEYIYQVGNHGTGLFLA